MLSLFVIIPLVVASTFFALLLIDRERATLAKRSLRHIAARQSSHSAPTPRVGGVAIAVGILSGALLSGYDSFGLLLWTALPIFLVGLFEDLGPDTPASFRLGVAAISSILAVVIFDTTISRISFSPLDPVFALPLVALGFTIFACVGFTHAMNLIDGLNGLSSAIVIFIMASFALVAYRFGHSDLLALNLVVIAAFSSFILVNFPFGRIFLGDAGAYSVGHIIAWNAIFLLGREPQISAWGILLILLWPVLDTVFAMLRRARMGSSIYRADRLHFHHVVMRLIMICAPNLRAKSKANPIASFLIWPFACIPCALGICFINNTEAAMMSIGMFTLLYSFTFSRLVRNAYRLRAVFT